MLSDLAFASRDHHLGVADTDVDLVADTGGRHRVAGRAEAGGLHLVALYLQVAPGVRPHVAVDRRAPVAEFERIATRYRVFRILSDSSEADVVSRQKDAAKGSAD